MAFQPVPDTAEVTLVFTQNGENITNTFHAEKPGGYNLGEISALADLVDNSVAANIRPVITIDCTYVRTEVRGLAVENDLFDVDGTNGGPGADPTEGLPNSVTLSLKKSSGFTGRSARGRWYWIGLPVNALDTNENFLTAARAADAVIAVNTLRGDVLAGPWTPVIVSRFAGGVQRPVGVTFDWIDTVAVNNGVDSQRGRLSA